MNNILTNATILALLVSVATYLYQRWTTPIVKKRTRSGRKKKVRKKVWWGWPLITGTFTWVIIYCYQQFYRSDSKSMLEDKNASSMMNEFIEKGGITTNSGGLMQATNDVSNLGSDGMDGMNGRDSSPSAGSDGFRAVNNGLNIPGHIDDDVLPSVFVPAV